MGRTDKLNCDIAYLYEQLGTIQPVPAGLKPNPNETTVVESVCCFGKWTGLRLCCKELRLLRASTTFPFSKERYNLDDLSVSQKLKPNPNETTVVESVC